MGLGLSENNVLKSAPGSLYNFDKMGVVSQKIQNIFETFIKSESPISESSEKGKDKINDDLSDDNVDSQTPSFKSVEFKYDDLNTSYKNKKIEFTKFEMLFPKSSESVKSVPEVSTSKPVDSDSLKESKVENYVLESKSEKMSEFINSMNENIFNQMMNASDTNPGYEKFESNSENDRLSVLQKELYDLQKTVKELNDKKVDIQFQLDKSLNENKVLYKKVKQLEDLIFKRNQTETISMSNKKLF